MSLCQYLYSVQKVLKHTGGQKREGASKLLKVFPFVLVMQLNNSQKSHRSCKPTSRGGKEFRVGVMRCWQVGQEEIWKEKELASANGHVVVLLQII